MLPQEKISPAPLEVVAAQLDTIVASAPLGIGLFDLEIRHVRVNPRLAEMNGLAPEAMIGRTPAELNGEVGRAGEEMYRSVILSGEPQRDVQLSGEVGTRPGDTRHWSVSFFPIRQEGDIIGLCVVVDDVTHEHGLATALAESEQQHRQLADALQLSLTEQAALADQLKAALASRSVIDQALGIIMAQSRVSAEEAFTTLRTASQHRNVKLREVAQSMVESVTGRPPTDPPVFRASP
jgi:PAS domain S-box-containing protein